MGSLWWFVSDNLGTFAGSTTPVGGLLQNHRSRVTPSLTQLELHSISFPQSAEPSQPALKPKATRAAQKLQFDNHTGTTIKEATSNHRLNQTHITFSGRTSRYSANEDENTSLPQLCRIRRYETESQYPILAGAEEEGSSPENVPLIS